MINTTAARVDLAKARAAEISLPQITHISVGTGGLSGGVPRTPAPSETALVTEVLKKSVTFVGRTDNQNHYKIELDATECNGSALSEMGVWAGSTLVAIDTFTAKNKDENMTMTFDYVEVF